MARKKKRGSMKMSNKNFKMDLEEFHNELLVGAEKERQERKKKQKEYHARELAKAEAERQEMQGLLNKAGETIQAESKSKG